MSQNIRVWQVTEGDRLVEITSSRLDFEERLENWLAENIGILDENLLVIGRQVLTDFGGYIDLLCIDMDGNLAVVELKRDKTPRDITAQGLDYASWVVDLSHERVLEIATQYLNQPFEKAFQNKFGIELPDTLNSNHRIIIVASKIDPSSERIIGYLSSRYGVSINAVTFQYFRSSQGNELLTRVFLIEPQEVDYRARTKGGAKRKPNLTYEQLQEIASENGVGEFYQHSIELLRLLFDRTRTTLSSISFVSHLNGSFSAIMNLIPQESSQSEGLKYQIYSKRLRECFNLDEETLHAILPKDAISWEYQPNADDNWRGYEGFFTSAREIETLIKHLRKENLSTSVGRS